MSDKVEDEHLEGQMSIIEHLTELRNRIGVVFICFIVMFFISVVRPFGEGSQSIADIVYTFLQAPLADVLLERGGRMIFTGLHEGFFTQIKVGFFTALCVTFPIMLVQIWKFVAPGLYIDEKKYIIPLIIFTFLSFLCGLIFAYMIVIPFSLSFFTSVGFEGIQNNFSINYYFSFITWLMIGSGLIFELPVIVFILSVIGLLTPAFMRHYRRYAIVIILVLSAFITPPDPVSLVLMSIPLLVLYELSIGVSWLVNRKKHS